MESTRDIEQSPPVARPKLLRVLGIAFGLAITVGGVIGAGIIRTPGQIAAQLPNAWLFIGVWVIGGIYTLICAPSIAELGTLVPRSGGLYVFAHRALGKYAGFVVGWSDWLTFCGTLAALSIIVGELAGRLLPPFAGHALMIASITLVAFAALQWLGIRWGSLVQQITSLLKVIAFVALGVAAFIFGGSGEPAANIALPTVPTGWAFFAAFIIALQGVIFTYDGYYAVTYYSEELNDPGRDIPRSMFTSIYMVIGIYLLINLSVLYALPMSQIAGNEFVGGALARAIFGSSGDTIITVLIIISTLGAINFGLLGGPRVLFSMSRDGLFSSKAVKVSKSGTPTVTLILTTMIALIFLLSGTFENVLALLTFFFVFNYTLTFASVFILRLREPDAARSYRAWGYPITTGLALIGAIAFLVGAVISDTRNSIYALLCLVLSVPLYHLIARAQDDQQN